MSYCCTIVRRKESFSPFKVAKLRSQLASPIKASHARTSHARSNLCFARTSHTCVCARTCACANFFRNSQIGYFSTLALFSCLLNFQKTNNFLYFFLKITQNLITVFLKNNSECSMSTEVPNDRRLLIFMRNLGFQKKRGQKETVYYYLSAASDLKTKRKLCLTFEVLL